ncbi:F-box/kelch-repeat protein At3g06240-like [Actinidia eriantha]|uniref:F-box/kelch-repeat protein At3g06240-like n=1 Tax=Actinidia eriantha TaxID=165200 RepID=UPI002588115B|nr:F-box/kelch-repeat protein At3g06240-like [Actinidia eriantha]
MHLNRAIEDCNFKNCRALVSTFPLQSINSESTDNDDDAIVVHDFPPTSVHDRFVQNEAHCNGLICLAAGCDHIFLWNPATKRSKELPKPGDCPVGSFHYGLGYDSSTDDYKIVRVLSTFGCKVHDIQVGIFSLKSNTWRVIQGFKDIHGIYGPGTFLNGELHWLVSRPEGTPVIVSFDLATEISSQEVVPPPCQGFTEFTIQSVGVTRGYLSVLGGDNTRIETWVMKEYGVRESWTKQVFRPPPVHEYLIPLCFSKNGDVLLSVEERRLAKYDPEERRYRYLKMNQIETKHGQRDWFRTIAYVETLVSPNGIDASNEAQTM